MRGAWRGMMRWTACAIWTSLALFLVLCAPSKAETCLAIGAPSGAGATDEIMDAVKQAGKRAGLCVRTVRAPRNRLSALPLDGAVLTEAATPELDGLVALPTPVVTFEGTLYWLPGHKAPTGHDAQIGVILGQEWALRAVAERGSQPYEVRDNRQLMKMMEAGRLDGMMLPSISFRHFLPAYPDLKGCHGKAVIPLPVRVLLKPAYRDAADALDRALAAMKRDGTTEAIFNRYAP